MRTNDTVWRFISIDIEGATFVCSIYALIHQRPKKSSRTRWVSQHQFPKIFQPCSMSAIVKSVHKFSRQINLLFIQGGVDHIRIVRIMSRIKSIEPLNGVQHYTLLRVVLCKIVIEIRIPPALIAIVPEYNTRMIHITNNHFSDQLLAYLGIIRRLPSTQLIENKQSQGITQVQEFRVWRIVRHADCIHVHVFYQSNIIEMNLPAQRTSGLRPKAVPVHSFKNHPLAINVDPIASLHLYRSKSKTLLH